MAYNYNPSSSTVPYQKLPMREKTEEWKKENIDAFIGKSYFGNTNGSLRKHEMKIAYDLYNSIFDEKDFKYITDPYKVSEGFPASLQDFNIIKPKVDLLRGERTKRPDTFKVAQTNEEATTRLQEKLKEMLTNTVMDIASEGDPDQPVTEKDVDKVAQVAEYMGRDFSDIAENTAYHTLNYLKEKLNLKDLFNDTFHDLICGSMLAAYVGQINGDPFAERVNPLSLSFDSSPDVKFIEDGDWAVRKMRMSPAAVYDRFYDIMDEKALDELLERFRYSGAKGKGDSKDGPYGIVWRDAPFGETDDSSELSDNSVYVWHVTWKSLKKIGFVTYFDEEGEEQQDVVDETYEPMEGEEVVWDWIHEVWEGYRIDDDIYVGIRPLPEQSVSIDNPNSAKLPYVGLIANNNNTSPRSLVEIMKPLQYFYIAIVYQLQLAIARDKGKVITVDVTQIPKSMGMDANKWLHFLSSTGVNFVNPYETGWDIPGREGGKHSPFNQYGQTDLTMSKVIAEYVQLMDKIEDMIGELSGVSRQRQGQVQSSELVGNVQQTIIQSSHITEPLFYTHDLFKRNLYNQLLNVAKTAWQNSGKKKLHYFTDDMTRIFMDITDDFLYSDMDIFVTDSTKENQDIDALKSLAQPAMQNGASLLDAAELFTSNNLTDLRNKLKKIEKMRQQREQELARIQQETAAQQAQVQMEIEQSKLAIEQAKLEQSALDSQLKAETQIQVALIQADSKEAIESSKIDMQESDQSRQAKLKERELDETIRSNMSEEEIKRIAARNKPATQSK